MIVSLVQMQKLYGAVKNVEMTPEEMTETVKKYRATKWGAITRTVYSSAMWIGVLVFIGLVISLVTE